MEQQGILTVTFNPALDASTSVAHVIAGPKLRCAPPRFDPGGGGVNVARAICKLGGHARALVAVGGAMGDRLLDLLAAESVPTLPVPVSAETRLSFAVTDNSTGGQFRFSVPGDALNSEDAGRLLTAIPDKIDEGAYLLFSGSVAPGLPYDFQSQVIAAVAHKAPKIVVDTSNVALNHLIEHPGKPVHLLRIDQKEAEQVAGHPLETVSDSFAFGAELVTRGVAEVVVTGRGAEGSVLVSRDLQLICHPPQVEVVSMIGAGDAFVGAMTLALARGEELEMALKWGVAAASATVSTEGTALCDEETVKSRFAVCITQHY